MNTFRFPQISKETFIKILLKEVWARSKDPNTHFERNKSKEEAWPLLGPKKQKVETE